MPLSPGIRLGPYEIVAQLGAGGMGIVYRARDARLNRDVALKVLPDGFAADADRLARFRREAQLLASLNHPNIAAIHGFEESDGVQALVLELVEGATLAERIAQGPVPLDEALPIARQIVDALEAAHEQGVVHRDLKPANIKVRPDGAVKVLDFGLAKAFDSEPAGAAISMAPTITSPAATRLGTILGTAAYMSPEQARGKPVDRRTDIWAFGCVLYELLTGLRAFDGDDVSDALANVLKVEPQWNSLPADVPPRIRQAMRACLHKDPRQRVGDAQSLRLALDGAFESAPLHDVATPNGNSIWRRAIPVAVAASLASVVVGTAVWSLRPSAPPPAIARFSYSLSEGQAFTDVFLPSVAISPDGTQVVYVANRRLYLRSMSDLEARPIAGTETQTNMGGPVFSPDGLTIAYWTRTGPPAARFTGIPGALRRIATSGGTPVTIAQIDHIPLGLRWEGDTLLFGYADHGVMRVPANGGSPEALVEGKSGEVTAGPQLLPGGDALLFTVAPSENGVVTSQETWDQAKIVVQSLASGERKTLITGGSDARYLSTGHLVYAVGGVLLAVPFDVRRQEIIGGAVPITEGVSRAGVGAFVSGLSHFSVADNGSAVYIPGPTAVSDQRSLVLTDRTGRTEPLKLPTRSYQNPRISPDGRQLAFFTDDGKDSIVWIYDLSGTSAVRRLTLEGANRTPVWSPDGQRLAFQSDREGDRAIFWQRADGTRAAERLTKPDKGAAHLPESWSPDGTTLLFAEIKDDISSLWVLSLKDLKAAPFGDVQSSAAVPPSSEFSPDGRWVAYITQAGGPSQLLVQPFPTTGAKYLVADAPSRPQWSDDGKELFFSQGSQLRAVSVDTRKGFSLGNPVQLPISFAPILARGQSIGRQWDVMPDGQRFIAVVAPSSTAGATQTHVVLNWLDELRRLVPSQ